jgi:hypothetical protein
MLRSPDIRQNGRRPKRRLEQKPFRGIVMHSSPWSWFMVMVRIGHSQLM